MTAESDGSIYTIGHSTHPISNFISMLNAYDIGRVVDIRTMPRSRYNPQFDGMALAASLEAAHIAYMHMQALGGLRHARKDSVNTGWRNKSFRGYADYMETPAFKEALGKLVELGREGRTAIMCAESVPWRCHRSLVSDALTVRHVPVMHIMSATQSKPHTLTDFAHVHGTEIVYEGEQAEMQI